MCASCVKRFSFVSPTIFVLPSGLGVISRDQSVKIQRTTKDILRTAHLQKELLCAAVDAVSAKSATGGIIVYSTCSVSVAENEQVGTASARRRALPSSEIFLI